MQSSSSRAIINYTCSTSGNDVYAALQPVRHGQKLLSDLLGAVVSSQCVDEGSCAIDGTSVKIHIKCANPDQVEKTQSDLFSSIFDALPKSMRLQHGEIAEKEIDL